MQVLQPNFAAARALNATQEMATGSRITPSFIAKKAVSCTPTVSKSNVNACVDQKFREQSVFFSNSEMAPQPF